ncbi:MAG TPA: family 10 glycosylhydrolase [Saprospiraceae bacterium]|nr:family 10 glycosylhydrolase [Saprospiraceae bacterium]HMQ84711.1 family 10 glycosylhydrolase [Saprospiraceae bacterium]
MDKRAFLKTLGKAGAAYLTAPWLQACSNDQHQQKAPAKLGLTAGLPDNWMWLRPDLGLTDEEWKVHFDKIRAAGIEAVLPQIFDGVFAYFDHPNYPIKEILLERLIPLAHAAGLQIHAWMWCMPSNHPEILEKHPDWYAVNGKGEPANLKPAYVDYYKFLCPCHPEVRNFVQERVSVLANIAELDGIHLDYIRVPDVILAEGLQPKYNIVQDKEYPEYDYSYSTYCREQFKAQTGIDPLTDLKAPAANEAWRQFRYDAVNELVNDFLVPAAKKGNKVITAAVFPNWESVRQQWHRWNLDAFLPMLYHGFYNAPVAWIGEQVEAALNRLDQAKPVYSGLFVPHLSPEELELAIDVSRAAGAKGVSLFSYKDISEAHWAALHKKAKE